MAEHARKNGYQWVDAEVCMVWDRYISEPARFYKGGHVGPLDAAMEYVTKQGLPERVVVLRLPAIVAHALGGALKTGEQP